MEGFSPHVQVIIAVVPFVSSLIMRLALGNNRLTRGILSLSTMWFAIYVLTAPYSMGLRQEIFEIGSMFR